MTAEWSSQLDGLQSHIQLPLSLTTLLLLSHFRTYYSLINPPSFSQSFLHSREPVDGSPPQSPIGLPRTTGCACLGLQVVNPLNLAQVSKLLHCSVPFSS